MYADAGKFTRCISLWNHALDIQRGSLEPAHQMTVSSFFSFAELFSFMTDAYATNEDNGYRQVPALLTFEDVIQVLVKAVNELCERREATLSMAIDLSPRLLLISLDLFNMALKYDHRPFNNTKPTLNRVMSKLYHSIFFFSLFFI